MITLEDCIQNEELTMLVEKANNCLEQVGYTDHGPRHVLYVSKIAGRILEKLNYPIERVELAKIAGYLHDVGNLVNRRNHGITGGLLLYPLLKAMGMDLSDVCDVVSAVGSHEEEYGSPVGDISAALIIADKVDAYRARVRKTRFDPNDIHDRVNNSITKTHVDVDLENRKIIFDCIMDETSSVTEYMEIYLSRTKMTEKSAKYLDCEFILSINGVRINR